ncbi:hypothetical protein TEA_017889 [Camellia sinensis var. sinensis]|uniref:Starch synthase catalytic domain-containing protein n=1 Tax=Camellia sinensis var. sinensis TaxID=542762 RepID=A0A4S4DZF7_CAMSN|nr:hypothetical protein TEA_017889 [Camellia sinensis var. sinensis]
MTHNGLRSLNKLDMLQMKKNAKAIAKHASNKNGPKTENDRPSSAIIYGSGMNIVFVGAEVGPWSKTGGLGDVLGGLPPAMAGKGHRVMTVSPRYDQYKDAWDTHLNTAVLATLLGYVAASKGKGHRVMTVSPRYDQYKDAWDTHVLLQIKIGDRIETVRFFHCYKRGVDRVFVDHPMFLEKAEECLKQEKDRVAHYPHSSSELKLLEVPSLEHNNEIRGESLDLLNYIDSYFEGPALYPDDPTKREFAEELLSYTNAFNLAVITSLKGGSENEISTAFDYLESALFKFTDGPFFLDPLPSFFVAVPVAPQATSFWAKFQKRKEKQSTESEKGKKMAICEVGSFNDCRLPREGPIPEDVAATEPDQSLDKNFGYNKNFGAEYELGNEGQKGRKIWRPQRPTCHTPNPGMTGRGPQGLSPRHTQRNREKKKKKKMANLAAAGGSINATGSGNSNKPHAVFIPFPLQGHITPLLKLAKLFHHRGFQITFVNAAFIHRRLLKSSAAFISSVAGFRFKTMPDSLPFGDDEELSPQLLFSICQASRYNFLLPFRQLISKLNDDDGSAAAPVTCIVSDALMAFPITVAQEIGVPGFLFWPNSACGFMSMKHYNLLKQRSLIPLKEITRTKVSAVHIWLLEFSKGTPVQRIGYDMEGDGR